MRYLLIPFVYLFFLFPPAATAQSFHLGFDYYPGVAKNANSFYLSPAFNSRYGASVCYMLRGSLGFSVGVQRSFFSYDINYEKQAIGTQTLQYTDIPLSVYLEKVLNPDARVPSRFYGRTGAMLSFLNKAHFTPLSPVFTPYSHSGPSRPMYDEDNKEDFRSMTVCPFVALGFKIGIVRDFDLVLGADLSSAVTNQHRTGEIQGFRFYSLRGSLALHAGVLFCLWSPKDKL